MPTKLGDRRWQRTASCGHVVVHTTSAAARTGEARNSRCSECSWKNPIRRKRPSRFEDRHGEIERLCSEGLSNRQIHRETLIPRAYINDYLASIGYAPKVVRGQPPEPVDADHSRCRKCGEIVRNDEFPFVISRKDGRRLSYCRKCRYKQYRDGISSSPEKYFHARVLQIRKRAVASGIPFNLTDEHLLFLWEHQKGLCFYTGAPLETTLNRGLRLSATSVDKVVISRGYTIGNVVLCTNRANSIKYDQSLEELREWMPGWYQRLVECPWIDLPTEHSS